MREIKFRAWDEEESEIFYSSMYQDKTSMGYGLGNFLKECSDIEDTLMQYTGLKDKNGVEIYEGDVIDYDGEIAKVTYENTMASFCVGGNSFNSSEAKYMKIIGNIYEDSHLLDNN